MNLLCLNSATMLLSDLGHLIFLPLTCGTCKIEGLSQVIFKALSIFITEILGTLPRIVNSSVSSPWAWESERIKFECLFHFEPVATLGCPESPAESQCDRTSPGYHVSACMWKCPTQCLAQCRQGKDWFPPFLPSFLLPPFVIKKRVSSGSSTGAGVNLSC